MPPKASTKKAKAAAEAAATAATTAAATINSESESDNETEADFPCIECKKSTDNGDGALQCFLCSRWQHGTCNIEEMLYQLIMECSKKYGKHTWACDGCSLGVQKLHALSDNNRRRIDTIETDVSNLKKSATGIKKNTDQLALLSQEVEKLKAQPSARVEDPNAPNPYDLACKEMELREQKKSKLMIFNLPEQDRALQPLEKKTQDELKILEIFSSIGNKLEMKKDIKFVDRIGELKDKNRPVQVGFTLCETRERVLGSAWQLARGSYRTLSLAPDLTKKQQEEDDIIVKECARLNREMQEKNPEEAKNWVWRAKGTKGSRVPRKVRRKTRFQPVQEGAEPVRPGPGPSQEAVPLVPRGRTPSVVRTREEMEEGEEEGEGHVPPIEVGEVGEEGEEAEGLLRKKTKTQ